MCVRIIFIVAFSSTKSNTIGPQTVNSSDDCSIRIEQVYVLLEYFVMVYVYKTSSTELCV